MKKIAHLLSKAFFWGFSLFSVFVLLFSMLSFLEYYLNWNIPFVEILERENQSFSSIKIPVIQIRVEFLLSYTVILMWLTFVFYSIFFYVLQSFFQIFIAKKTFEEKSMNQLSNFYKLNFIPVLAGILGVILKYILAGNLRFDEPHFIVLIHLIIAFFIYFYLDLIRKGNNIQQENDLTI